MLQADHRFLVIHFLYGVLIVVCESKIRRMWKRYFPSSFALSPLPVERTPLICNYLFIYLFACLFTYKTFTKQKQKQWREFKCALTKSYDVNSFNLPQVLRCT